MRHIGLALICIALTAGARAESRGEWFKSLTVPGKPASSCCDISDCRLTEADWHDGQWWAYSRARGKSVPIPADRVLTDKASFDGEAYLCESAKGETYCFIRPSPGS